ncbi:MULTISPECIES: transglutaminase N-terminal domain-containing protein [unclassified Polaribacter]|uniref:transglutaminase family protein n=1 Tax=unclassified Polaribacter TaxID=196858 RepID=UPI0011BF3FF1|nr:MULTISPECIES: transglutaminase family protein [unclassified Polaribacter]TXD50322.1 transglutaminase family protein [Polaribacter sp. IC063]TXD56394.1 transglutaminase family protein [Polaribacter sp. IC066]
MLFSVIHKTAYNYEGSVTYCHNIAYLKPKEFIGQKLVDYRLEITPTPTYIEEDLDFFGNTVIRFSIDEPHKELIVTAISKVERSFDLEADVFSSEICKNTTVKKALEIIKNGDEEILKVYDFILDSQFITTISDEITSYAKQSLKPESSLFEATKELMERIFKDFKFDAEFSTIATPLDEVMKEKKGVCQDFAQIGIACLRSIGLPARYVSGYIETLPPPGKEKLVGTDASHAWFSVYIPHFGWVDFDPTNNQIPKNQHITVSYGRDYYDVPPLKGVLYGSGGSKMKVSVDIRPAK